MVLFFLKKGSFLIRAKLTFLLHLVNTELKLFHREKPPVGTAPLLHSVVKDSKPLKRKFKKKFRKEIELQHRKDMDLFE